MDDQPSITQAPAVTAPNIISLERFRELEEAVRSAGYSPQIRWSENVGQAHSARHLARETIYVICNSGMRNSIARGIFSRCMTALKVGQSATTVFGHPGKAAAIDTIWRDRKRLFTEYRKSNDRMAFFAALPWIGPITKFHLAKNLGGNFAKPDVHLNRLADAEGCSAQELCDRLAAESGYRAATIDLILWRACADGILDSKAHLERSQNPTSLDPAD